MTSWVPRLLPRNVRSLAASSENQRVEDGRRHQEAYGYFLPIQTRWQDNDQYGHVNNAVYYSYFDTIINHYLIRYCGLKTGLRTSPTVGFMVTNQCTFHTPVGFPQIPVAAFAVDKVGRSSVHYRLALFPPKPAGDLPAVEHRDFSDGFFFGHPRLAQFAALACTTGSAVHVFVNPATGKPTGLPEDFRPGLLRLVTQLPNRIKDLEISSSWIMQVGPKANDTYLYKRHGTQRKERPQDRGRVE
uniref:Thioesterase domain-containing protein n=1 Tax=Sus scrofa TaxID=9823 RepID=A0A8D1L8F8_PIG